MQSIRVKIVPYNGITKWNFKYEIEIEHEPDIRGVSFHNQPTCHQDLGAAIAAMEIIARKAAFEQKGFLIGTYILGAFHLGFFTE